MGEMEKSVVVVGGDGRGEEEERLLEGVAMLDFDMLCATVAMQAQNGKWGKLVNLEDEEDVGGDEYGYGEGRGAFRMWEGELLYDCLDDRRIAIQSTWYEQASFFCFVALLDSSFQARFLFCFSFFFPFLWAPSLLFWVELWEWFLVKSLNLFPIPS